MITVKSFSYKHGPIPSTMHKFDVRALPNPFKYPELQALDGRDKAVQDFLAKVPLFDGIVDTAVGQLLNVDDDKVLAFGCIGGRHRSVAVAEAAAQRLRERGYAVTVEHTAL